MSISRTINGVIFFVLLNSTAVIASEFGTVVPINKKGLSTYYVTGSIQGFGDTDFLIDTGSGHSAINEETITSLNNQGKAEFVKNVSATLANGSSITMPVYRISDINIGGTCSIQNVEVIILPGKTRNILGLSALEKIAPFAISVNPPQLLLSQCHGANA